MLEVYKNTYTPEETDKPVMIFDMDGTLSNDSQRLPLWEKGQKAWKDYLKGWDYDSKKEAKDWFTHYHSLGRDDKHNEHPLMLLETAIADPRFETWVLTGRTNIWAGATASWLQRTLHTKGRSGDFDPTKMVDRIIMQQHGVETPTAQSKVSEALHRIPMDLLPQCTILDNDQSVIDAFAPYMSAFKFQQFLQQ